MSGMVSTFSLLYLCQKHFCHFLKIELIAVSGLQPPIKVLPFVKGMYDFCNLGAYMLKGRASCGKRKKMYIHVLLLTLDCNQA